MFTPDTRLFRPDADLLLVFLSGNGVAFFEPTMDPWYRGSIPYANGTSDHVGGPNGWSKTLYRPDEAASPMGCIERHQFCNAERKCGELASFYDAITTAAPFLNLSKEWIYGYGNVSGWTSAHFSWFLLIISNAYDLSMLLSYLGVASLVSHRSFETGFGPLPSNQWQLDATYWWTTLLAGTQAAFVSAAHGPTDPLLFQFTLRLENKYMEQLCRNQVRLHIFYPRLSSFV